MKINKILNNKLWTSIKEYRKWYFEMWDKYKCISTAIYEENYIKRLEE